MITSSILLGVIGPWQIVLIVAIVLIFFGGRKIPELMKGMGKGIRSFKEGMGGEDEEKENNEKENKKA